MSVGDGGESDQSGFGKLFANCAPERMVVVSLMDKRLVDPKSPSMNVAVILGNVAIISAGLEDDATGASPISMFGVPELGVVAGGGVAKTAEAAVPDGAGAAEVVVDVVGGGLTTALEKNPGVGGSDIVANGGDPVGVEEFVGFVNLYKCSEGVMSSPLTN